MLDLVEINNTIAQLENEKLSFAVCDKLASLITIKNHYTNEITQDIIEKEYSDILPQYKVYCNDKRLFQLGKCTQNTVETSSKELCREIKEFLITLYNHTDMHSERVNLISTLNTVLLHFKSKE